jgi:hypothetical protein
VDPVSTNTGAGDPPFTETYTIGKRLSDSVSAMASFCGIGVPLLPALSPRPVPAPPVPPAPLVPGEPTVPPLPSAEMAILTKNVFWQSNWAR